MTDTTLPERQQARLLAAFLAAESSGLKLATAGRMAALGVIGVWGAIIGDFPADFFYYAVIGGFAVVGLLQLWVNGLGPRWRFLLYVTVLADAVLMMSVLALPNTPETHW